jgi:hypothetical protein
VAEQRAAGLKTHNSGMGGVSSQAPLLPSAKPTCGRLIFRQFMDQSDHLCHAVWLRQKPSIRCNT